MNNTDSKCDHISDRQLKCLKFAQYGISYILNRELLQYNYCPPHAKEVQKDLAVKHIEFAVVAITPYNKQDKDPGFG
jgi:hypothetical protein